jgi:hypothetical protein
MKRSIITIAAIVIATTASAQEAFNGTCTTYGDQTACQATQWCAWRKGRQVELPDGGKVEVKGSCAFKPHFKAAYAAKAQSTPQQ